MRATKKMAKKLKVYGKKKGRDIAFKFGKLTLSSPSDRSEYPPTWHFAAQTIQFEGARELTL